MPKSEQKFPLLEVVFRAGDTRPVVVQLFSGEGSAFEGKITPGSADDMAQLHEILYTVLPMISSAQRVREIDEHIQELLESKTEGDDEIPF